MIDLSYTLCIINITAVSKQKSIYDINDFLEACKGNRHQPSGVVLMGGVGKTASKDFSLKTRDSILAFITGGGLENLEYVNSLPFRLSAEIPPPICDAYTFKSGFTDGYISFFFSASNKRWVIKSFHRDDKCGPPAMEIALRKAGFLPESPERSE